ncbi:MAG: MBL fold metallo-hydrolase [Actinobacteria bacterium]|nr:MBL fold metallo-hydrolase [Actinomycetota bacterium]
MSDGTVAGRNEYAVEIVLPTARFVFAVRDGAVEVEPEHRSPEAFRRYREMRRGGGVVGMTTFPNTVVLRGPRTILVDPGMDLQNEPLLTALEERGLAAPDLDLVALTHAHGDHVGALADLDRVVPVAVHEAEMDDPLWSAVSGLVAGRPLQPLRGERGELAPGVRWLHTPGHSAGSVCFLVETADGLVVIAGDTVGPLPETFAAMEAPLPGAAGECIVSAWRALRALRPALIVPGHLPPFRPE